MFYPRRLAQIIMTYGRVGLYALWLERLRRRCQARDPNKMQYTDLAITRVTDETSESLELYELNDSARAAVEQARARQRRASRAAAAAATAP